jgi:hypothetical protein
MPGRVRDGTDLRLGLLDAVLAEDGQAGRDRGDETLGRDGLRDRDEGDVRRVTARPRARVRDPREDPGARVAQGLDLVGIDSAADARAVYFRRRNEGISRSSAS